MKFIRVYIHVPTQSVCACHESDGPHTVDLLVGEDIFPVCLGAVDPDISPGVSPHSFLMTALEVVPGAPPTLRFKNPAHEQFLHRCPTMADALQSGDHDLPEPVKAHLRGRWAHRDGVPLKAFRNIGFTYAEIRALPKFQLLQHRQQAAIADKKQAELDSKKAEASQARVARTLEKKRIK